MVIVHEVWVALAIVGAVGLSLSSGKIDRAGGVIGGVIAYLLFLGVGWLGIILIGGFFVLGTLASQWKHRQKIRWGVAESRGGRRGWRNVVANAGVVGLLAAGSWWYPAFTDTGRLLISACFAAALSDTWSSELGTVYGTKFYHVLTGKKDRRGQDGVVSVEGSVAGALGSAVVASLYGLAEGWSDGVGVVFLAGIVGNLMDSVLGATLERKGVIGNHTVNFLNTLTAVLFAYFFMKSCSINS